ncbi:hypothetical protein OEA41_010750 [Lepraria neglecta]|uniref:Peptidylprolyl isomerase n=1 Tax=Lepraria neglecta TaxID=209136 RepID=A0AAE0DHZ9_9LECA|nr:hypothetical protein OEA41_010750 [Lepraria neglecta]
MGVTRKVIKQGNGTDKPKNGDEVTIEYTGNLHDSSVGPEKDFRGKQYADQSQQSSEVEIKAINGKNAEVQDSQGEGS